MKIGDILVLRQGLKLVKGVVISVDLTFITVKLEYKKGQNCTLRIKNNSKDIVKINGIDVNPYRRDVI